jgi:hypothetical protein
VALWASGSPAFGHAGAGLGLRRDLVATALSIALEAWEAIRISGYLTPRSRETAIAGALVRAMWDILEAQPEPPIFRPEEEVGTRGPNDRAPTGRVDIKIIGGFRYDDFLLIECKRVRGGKQTLARKYVADGVMRFVSARYAPGHERGVLFGFVVEGSAVQAALHVAAVLAGHAGVALTRPLSIDLSWNLPVQVHSSRHIQRLSFHHEITLLHLFLSL